MAGRRLTIAARPFFRCAFLSLVMASSAALTGCVVEAYEPDDEETSIYESELEDFVDIGDPTTGADPTGDPGGDSSEPEPTPWRATPDDSDTGPTLPPCTKSTGSPPKGGADEQ